MLPPYLSISLVVTLRAGFLELLEAELDSLNQLKSVVPVIAFLFLFLAIQETNQIIATAIIATGNKNKNALKNTNNRLKIISATKTSATIPKKLLILSPIQDFPGSTAIANMNK